jgi:hypothetical protein
MPNRIFVVLLGAWFVGSSAGYALDQPAAPTNWHLDNIGVIKNAAPEKPRAPIVIAIVDDGVRVSHRDLKELIWTNQEETPGNRIDDDGNGFVDDVHGWDVSDGDPVAEPPDARLTEFYHGTHLAGIVAQLVRESYSTPASDLVRIMPVKALSDGADRPYIKDGYKGIEYAVRAGADIVLCAWGVGNISPEQERILEEAHERGVLIVASAGNFPEGRDQYPAAHDSVIGVAALDAEDKKTAKSNFGAFVNLSAPGEKILSTSATSDTAYEERDGTSQSAALVAGAAAIVKLQHPSFSKAQMTACLKQTATNIEGVNERYNARLGAGRLNVGSAAECPLFDDTTRQRRMLSNPQGFLRITRTEKAPFSWVIRTSGPIGGIRFTPRISGGRSADSTVEFFREESGQPRKVGNLLLSDFHSDFFVPGNTAYVAVATVGAGEDLDWLLEYRAEPIDLSKFYCRDTVHLYEEGTIDDGSGAHDYTYDNDCKWLITAPEGKVIEFKFIEFDTQPKVDFVYFFNGSGTHEDIMAGFSGPEIPPEFKTWSNQVLVWFVTDGDVQGKGWKAEYRFRDPDPPGTE